MVFFVAAGAYAAAAYFLLKNIEEVSAIPLKVAEISRKTDEFLAARHFLSGTVVARAALREFFFRDDDLVHFLGEVEDAARKTNVSLTLKSVDAETAGNLDIEAEVSGSWESVARFLTLVETYPGPIGITRISRNKTPAPEDGRSTGKWSGSLTFILKSYIGS